MLRDKIARQQGNKRAVILSCIEKYKSKELDRFIKSMDKYLLKD